MTCRLEPGVYYSDGNGSPLFITEVDYHSFSLTILTTIISSLNKAYRSAIAAKPYVQACHKLQYADRSSKDMGDLLSLRYGASEPDQLRNFLVELSIQAFLGVSYRIPQKSLKEMDRSDHSRFVQFCEVTANKVPQAQRTRYVKRALRDIDKQYLSQLQQELNGNCQPYTFQVRTLLTLLWKIRLIPKVKQPRCLVQQVQSLLPKPKTPRRTHENHDRQGVHSCTPPFPTLQKSQ